MISSIRLRPFRNSITIATLLLIAFASGHAQSGCVIGISSSCAPEIDSSLASSGTALIAGLVLLIRGRRKR